jgi:hypothetical protein
VVRDRQYDMRLTYTRTAVELAPHDGGILNTLALAEYREGHRAESIAAGGRAMALRKGGEASDWFFLETRKRRTNISVIV